MSERWGLWKRNVLDKYKELETEEIKNELKKSAHPFSALMEHWQGDFNISTLIRNANSFNAKSVYYIGKKRYDRRGTVGAHHYIDLHFLGDKEELLSLKEKYTFVVFENNTSKPTVKLNELSWPSEPLLIFGEEGIGVSDVMMELADIVVEIPQFGSVRSLNCGTASGIAMYDFCCKEAGTMPSVLSS